MAYLQHMFDTEININVLCALCVRQLIGARLAKRVLVDCVIL